ncbi:maleylpyruvate isomerase family mycothiol-dependent enzyme [Cryobacterium sinapicolor]|uniref:Maleylpyruvate isomerase family mycothiol-dependent enzyme n=1 Tax=Cryobacterium sinapicolor TaxID=1259236 RepID=A0ABY2IU22_9MICO|nr:maleylpyruvate isomerase family mycothiol-dependent enzyme [Cryobacterium sinapicolor]TFC94609.1 maleylpyruvate isomerase family mycothiol-dependent enzyme [Cryobacterium sinapicolor]
MSAPLDPSENTALRLTLDLVQRGTEFFGRELQGLTDDDLVGNSLLPGWTRRQVVAHVVSNAGALGRLAYWADTGIETVMCASLEARTAEIEAGGILRPDALRGAWADSADDLERRWHSLPDDRWSVPVRNGQGAMVPLRETTWMRTRELWIHAVDLDHGAGFSMLPEEVLERLLGDIVGDWAARGDTSRMLTATDSTHDGYGDPDAAEHVTGSLADLAGWATGRVQSGVVSDTGETPAAPRWL